MTPTTDTQTKYVYRFGDGTAEGTRHQKSLLGGKGANLNEMSAVGLPVPPGYTITTEACRYFVDHGGEWPDGLEAQVREGIQHLEDAMSTRFGDPENPLLVSVRSGAALSMPGMMDTVLNLGINDEVATGFAQATGNERLAYDAYRRFIDMFGDVVVGKQPLRDPEVSDEFSRFMTWVDEFRTMEVRTNADTGPDATQALEFGAEGIGLCRTEHMFFGEERITKMRRMILSDSVEERQAALDALLPHQRADFAEIFRAMDGHPVTIRLLDPPLHEFLPDPDGDGEVADLAEKLGLSPDVIQKKLRSHEEFNPMLGHRGCRLGVTQPAITRMQARAIFEAALDVQAEGLTVQPEVMVPLVSTSGEFRHQKQVIEEAAATVFDERGASVDYQVGTMIEIPRAALRASEIAETADFFSFGTNDLTQLTFGYSRDDTGTFLPYYVEEEILEQDPFQVLDQSGVGELVRLGTERGRAVSSGLKVGICGEHGGEPSSVRFCYEIGLDYVSCSPYRVPVARLAAAQAALADTEEPELSTGTHAGDGAAA